MAGYFLLFMNCSPWFQVWLLRQQKRITFLMICQKKMIQIPTYIFYSLIECILISSVGGALRRDILLLPMNESENSIMLHIVSLVLILYGRYWAIVVHQRILLSYAPKHFWSPDRAKNILLRGWHCQHIYVHTYLRQDHSHIRVIIDTKGQVGSLCT